MSSTFSSQNPLGYTGIDLYTQPQFITADRNPTVRDIYPPGTQWENQRTLTIFETPGNGIWTSVSLLVFATQAQANAGISNDTVITPQTLANFINASGARVNVTLKNSAYAVQPSDYLISADSTIAAFTITLPITPILGRELVIFDGGGQALVKNITINGNGKNIAALGTLSPTKLLNKAYSSLSLYFNGNIWLGQYVV